MTMGLPDIQPAVPLKDTVVFPGVVTTITLSRPSAVRAVEWALDHDRIIFVSLEKTRSGFNDIGTSCHIAQSVRLPDGGAKVIIEGETRGCVVSRQRRESMTFVTLEPVPEIAMAKGQERGAVRALLDAFQKYVTLEPKMTQEFYSSICDIEEPALLCDVVAENTRLKSVIKQALLEETDVQKRILCVMNLLASESETLIAAREFNELVSKEIAHDQRSYFLREQLKVINDELGEGENSPDARELREAAAACGMPEAVAARVEREIKKFEKFPPMTPEAAVERNYIEALIELPWNKLTEDDLDIEHAKKVLDEDHYGLFDVKERIIEYLAVKKAAGDNMRGTVLCFVGPPGVGKTSLGRSIARAMGRKFINISLGGVHDEAEIRGHRRTYLGAQPGRVIQKIRNCESRNPLILMDEIDKMGSDYRGDPSAALLEVLDPEQNCHFTDNFLEVPFDLSKVMFITTANSAASIPRPLLDRMEIIELPGYVVEEKLEIAKKHLIPRIVKEHGISRMTFHNSALEDIVSSYTMEAGVRGLDKELAKIARKLAVRGKDPKLLSTQKVHQILGAPKIHKTAVPERNSVGNAVGLAWTETGGDVIMIEAAVMPGKGELSYTGNLGDIMQESAQTAYAYLKSHAADYELSDFDWAKHDIHIHVPAGAVPKDGPSAGVTLTLALASALSGRAVRVSYAMTGEATLTGAVLPIGGLREKILAAKRHGIYEIILPEANRTDADDLGAWILCGVKLHFVEHVSEVLELALCPRCAPSTDCCGPSEEKQNGLEI